MSALLDELTKINQNFPLPGKDNPSEGFRSNFAYIKNSLEYAEVDIEALKVSLSKTKTVPAPNLAGGGINSVTITVADSEYQIINVQTDIIQNNLAIDLTGFTDEMYSYTKLEVNNTTNNPITFSFGTGVKSPMLLSTLSLAVNSTYIFECWSTNGGITKFVNPVSQFKVW